MTIPFPVTKSPTSIACANFNTVMEVMALAKSLCLSASYHPKGGHGKVQVEPIAHTVWVMGDDENIKTLKESLEIIE